jgi:hypothetical protein
MFRIKSSTNAESFIEIGDKYCKRVVETRWNFPGNFDKMSNSNKIFFFFFLLNIH